MRQFTESLLQGKVAESKRLLNARLQELVGEKLHQVKIRLVTELFDEIDVDVDFVDDIHEAKNVQKSGRTKLIRLRVRNGKVQRRIRKSAVSGYTLRSGKMVRMSTIERRHRKMAARKSRYKRRAKLQQALRKRKRSIRRRQAMGIK